MNSASIRAAKGQKRTDKFFSDARLPKNERSELSDFVGSNFDRGHMAPAGNMSNENSMAQSFSLANMIPQAPANNRGAWSKIESDTRKYIQRAQGNVYVFTGPVFIEYRGELKNRVNIPSHIYKLVYDENKNNAWAHWIENSDEAKPSKPISYEELTKRIGVKLLPGIKPLV